jgi:hypothetical protein
VSAHAGRLASAISERAVAADYTRLSLVQTERLDKGCRAVRVEAAEDGRSLNPAAIMGFSANLRCTSRRCETLFGHLSGRQPLLNDSFAFGDGYYVYQEMPYEGRGSLLGSGLQGLLDGALKPLGI